MFQSLVHIQDHLGVLCEHTDQNLNQNFHKERFRKKQSDSDALLAFEMHWFT